VNESEVAASELQLENVRVVRLGHGANCSSIGSVVDALFASAVLGSAVFAVVLAAMKKEPVTIVGPAKGAPASPPEPTDPPARDDGDSP
jgi:hypothetical protein